MSDLDDTVHTADDAAADGLDVNVQQSDADHKGEAYEPSPYDEFAKRHGWRSPDEYNNPNTPFMSAEEYLEKSLRKTDSVRKEVKDMRKTLDRVVGASEKAAVRAVEMERNRLEAEFEARVEAGDAKGARAVEREIGNLEKDAASSRVNYEDSFAERNPWYGKDDEATAYAVTISQREANKGKTPEEQLEAAETAVRKRFPELYDKPARKAPEVSAPTTRTSSLKPREKGYSDLPEEAKRAHAKLDKEFKARGFKDGYSRDDYSRDYWQQ